MQRLEISWRSNTMKFYSRYNLEYKSFQDVWKYQSFIIEQIYLMFDVYVITCNLIRLLITISVEENGMYTGYYVSSPRP